MYGCGGSKDATFFNLEILTDPHWNVHEEVTFEVWPNLSRERTLKLLTGSTTAYFLGFSEYFSEELWISSYSSSSRR